MEAEPVPAMTASSLRRRCTALAYDGLVGLRRAAPLQDIRRARHRRPAPDTEAAGTVFKLRPNLRYSDGSPVRPEDFRARWNELFHAGVALTGDRGRAAVRDSPRAAIFRRDRETTRGCGRSRCRLDQAARRRELLYGLAGALAASCPRLARRLRNRGLRSRSL